jgi:transcriptional regulator with XRE-family HTH domain
MLANCFCISSPKSPRLQWRVSKRLSGECVGSRSPQFVIENAACVWEKMDYAKAVRTCRAIRGWQQADLAREAGLSQSFVSLVEAGQRIPSARSLKRIARALRVPEGLLSLLAMEKKSLPIKSKQVYEDLGSALMRLLLETSPAAAKAG